MLDCWYESWNSPPLPLILLSNTYLSRNHFNMEMFYLSSVWVSWWCLIWFQKNYPYTWSKWVSDSFVPIFLKFSWHFCNPIHLLRVAAFIRNLIFQFLKVVHNFSSLAVYWLFKSFLLFLRCFINFAKATTDVETLFYSLSWRKVFIKKFSSLFKVM